MLVELHRLPVILPRVGEEVAGHVLPRRDFHNGLRADALMDVQRDRVHFKKVSFLLLAFSCPLEPRSVMLNCLGDLHHLFRPERTLCGFVKEFLNTIRLAGGIKSQDRPSGWC